MPGIDETQDSFRYRVEDPSKFDSSSFRTQDLPNSDVKQVIGKYKQDNSPSGAMHQQSLIFPKDKFKTETEVKDWLHNQKIGSYASQPIITEEMPDELVCLEGIWNGENWPKERIEEAVLSTKQFIADTGNAPFAKLRHALNNQILSSLAFGFAKDIYTKMTNKGLGLFISWYKVPPAFKAFVKTGAIERRSIETWKKFMFPGNGKVYNNLIKAVSYFGTDIPAVSSLNEAYTLFYGASVQPIESADVMIPDDTMKTDAIEYLADCITSIQEASLENDELYGFITSLLALREQYQPALPTKIYSTEVPKMEQPITQTAPAVTQDAVAPAAAPAMDWEKKYKDQEVLIAQLKAENDKLKAELSQSTTMSANLIKDLSAKVEKIQNDQKVSGFNAFTNRMIEEGRYTPAEIEKMKTEKQLTPETYSAVSSLMETARNKGHLSMFVDQITVDPDKPAPAKVKNASKDSIADDQEINAYALKHKVAYKTAWLKVNESKGRK